ncbi:MAG: response regulator [Moraxellaceae bacterium]
MGLFDVRTQPAATTLREAPRYGVLLVDDEILNLTSLAGLLEDDYRIHVASSANEALSMLADPVVAAGVQVIVSDQRMPGMSGVELLAHTRTLCPDAKRVLLTGYTDIDAVVGAINEAAVWKYLRKPVDSQELRLTLQRACEAWQLERDNQALARDLARTLEKLRLLDADKTAFLHYLAHEMNTPLNWLSAVQVIDRAMLGDESRQMLGFVEQGQQRLRGLIEAVLRYFQVAGPDVRPLREQVDLSVLLSRMVRKAQQQGAVLHLQLEQPATLLLETDAELLAELLGHLLENAGSHALRAGSQPTVSLKVAHAAAEVTLSVHNSGDCLADEARAALMQPFFFCGSAHGSEGYGLSLATARALALALGGELDAPATENGVCLRLRLPCKLPPPLPSAG